VSTKLSLGQEVTIQKCKEKNCDEIKNVITPKLTRRVGQLSNFISIHSFCNKSS